MTGIERLRELAYRKNFLEPAEARELDAIADQIEREQDKVASTDWQTVRDVASDMAGRTFMSVTIDSLLEEWSRKLTDASDGRCPAADVSMSAYDLLPEEEREAIAWVRERGGIEHVRQQWAYLRGRANHADHVDRQLAKRQRQIDESHAALRRRNERIGFLVSELNRANHENHEMFMRRAGDYTAFADEVCKRLASELRHVEGCSKDVMDAALHALDRRLMPEGMEWPRFEDEEPVDFGDEVARDDGEVRSVDKVSFYGDQWRLYDRYGCEINEDTMGPGERVKRPAPKVLDADGAEIREKRDVWWICEGDERGVHAERLRVETICPDGLVECSPYNGGTWVCLEPSELYVNRPVLAADGKPLRDGETVWDKDGAELEVVAAKVLGDRPDRVNVVRKGELVVHTVYAGRLTHERPDSFERLEDEVNVLIDAGPGAIDLARAMQDYVDERGVECPHDLLALGVVQDVLRRSRALAERGKR